ncbi:MAG: hypothetical protein ABIN61_02305 [candidate division WOR-3 bacterium]
MKNKHLFALLLGLILGIGMLFYGVLINQFLETGFIGSVLCLSCIGIY